MEENNGINGWTKFIAGILVLVIFIATGNRLLYYSSMNAPDTDRQFTFSKEELLSHNRQNLTIGDMWFVMNSRDTFINKLRYNSLRPEMSMFVFHDSKGEQHLDCDVENIRSEGSDNYRAYVNEQSSLTETEVKECLVIALYRAKLKDDSWATFTLEDSEIDSLVRSMVE